MEQKLNGRGGASLSYIGEKDGKEEFVLIAGASRDEQFDDVWKVCVDQKTFAVDYSKLEVKEKDTFTSRNAMASIPLDE